MVLIRFYRQWNTKILTFSKCIGFDVTRYHYRSCSSLQFSVSERDHFLNVVPQGYCKNVRLKSRRQVFSYMASAASKIVIIGAGASGIAAATRFLENGFNDFIILEAESRIGGRIHSVEFADTIVDLGAQWCHGEKDNVVYKMTKDLNLLSPSTNNYTDFTFYLSDGTLIDKSITDTLLTLAFGVSDDEELAKNAGGTYGEYFIKEYRKRVADFLEEQYDENISEILIDWVHKAWMGLEAAKSWFEVSSTGPFRYKQCEGNLYLQWRNKGYKTIIDVLMKKIPDCTEELPLKDKIFLNKEVNKIVWDFNTKNAGGVTLHCSDGSFYNCDQVLITVSLGVLKNMLNNFEPKLPLIKQRAIESMAIGDVHKIMIKFTTKWWPDDLTGFSLVWNVEDRKKILKEFPHGPSDNGRSWLESIYGFYVIDSHPNILLGWAVGKMIKEIEQLSDDTVMDGCVFLLRKFVGKIFTISKPDGILRSVWKNNPNFNGCYTYLCLQAEKKEVSFEDLASPVDNSLQKEVVLFAGEATHSHYYSTVHGAIETGFREADRILSNYK